MLRVHIQNPKRKSKGGAVPKKKAARKRRKRRANPSPPPARRRRASRTKNPIRRRRRRSSLGGSAALNIGAEVKAFIPRLAGKLAAAWVAQRIGGAGSMWGAQKTSATAGSSWTLPQYLAALATVAIVPRFAGRWINAAEFRRGGMDLILTKLIWTEGIARSQWAQRAFGQTEGQVAYDAGSGQMRIYQGGRWNAMQGYRGMGALVGSSPLDGLVESSSLDGYGHLMPAGTSAAVARRGAYTGSGSPDPYIAQYGYRG